MGTSREGSMEGRRDELMEPCLEGMLVILVRVCETGNGRETTRPLDND